MSVLDLDQMWELAVRVIVSGMSCLLRSWDTTVYHPDVVTSDSSSTPLEIMPPPTSATDGILRARGNRREEVSEGN
jgi:hypothetical protein